ncbi:MAG: GDP-mannose 4,6-dehydratase [Chloroflexi bacterium]|nr:GDP-mannose 4,6-dehydratase [Chloroflexota bacterium]
MERLLITGAAGFVGRHLVSYLVATTEATIVALVRSAGGSIEPSARVEVCPVDLLDRARVAELVASVQPSGAFHLAAQSSVAESFAHPAETLANNILGQLDLLEALAAQRKPARVLVVGSNEEYGLLREPDRPVGEQTELRPASPYAVSKVLQDVLAFQYYAARGLPTVRVRPFNHTGPGHDERFVVPALAKQVAEIEAGTRDPVVRVGNVEVERDFTDVRDMVRAYHLALQAGEPGEVYNLGSGRAASIRELLDLLAAASRVRFRVEVDPHRLRPTDVPRQLCDASRFRALTGWRPEIPFEQTVLDTLNYWRRRVLSAEC